MGYLFLAISVAALIMSAWSLIRKMNCKKKVWGVFVKNHPMSGRKKGTQYAPVFRYEADGKLMEETSFECFSESKLEFYSGESYLIYINEKKPKDFVIDRSYNKEDLVIFGAALLCTIVFAFFVI